MPQTLTKYTLTANQGETVSTAWIDVSTATQFRIFIGPQQGGKYIARIARSTVNPAQNTPVVDYGDLYVCGQTETGGHQAASDVFKRTDELGANHIQIELTNVSSIETHDIWLLVETP